VRAVGSAEGGRTPLFNGKDLAGWRVVDEAEFARHGAAHVKDGILVLDAGYPLTGIVYEGEFPRDEYEVELQAMRVEGDDFFCGMTFPVGDSYLTWIVGGWGGEVVGLSNVDDLNASENETSRVISFRNGRWCPLRLRVAGGRVTAWVGCEQVIDLATEGRRLAIWPEQEPCRPLGVSTFYTTAAIRKFVLRRLPEPRATAGAGG